MNGRILWGRFGCRFFSGLIWEGYFKSWITDTLEDKMPAILKDGFFVAFLSNIVAAVFNSLNIFQLSVVEYNTFSESEIN